MLFAMLIFAPPLIKSSATFSSPMRKKKQVIFAKKSILIDQSTDLHERGFKIPNVIAEFSGVSPFLSTRLTFAPLLINKAAIFSLPRKISRF